MNSETTSVYYLYIRDGKEFITPCEEIAILRGNGDYYKVEY